MSDEKTTSKKTAAKAVKKPFFFPDVGNGRTVFATSREEAEKKLLSADKAKKDEK